MSENERENALHEDEGLDALLESSLDELPPDYIAVDVSPWKTAMDRVVLGTALSLFTLNFLYLNYILPLIGAIQLLLGLRRLRRENRAFMACYVISIFRAVTFFSSLVLNAAYFNSRVYAQIDSIYTNFLIAIIPLVYLLCLSNALGAVHRKAGLSGRVKGARSMVVWYIILVLLALISYSGIIIGLIMLVAYARIVFSLSNITEELSEAGYSVRCARVRISDRALTLSLLGVLAAAMVCCFVFFSSYPMDWQPVEAQRSERAERISAGLAELGYPEELLEDLSDEDIIACDGAVRVYVDRIDKRVIDSRSSYSNDGSTVYTAIVFYPVAVQMSDDLTQWRVFHHFRWLDGASFRGTETIYIQSYDYNACIPEDELGGQVLCERDGLTYASPYYSMDSGKLTTNGFFGEHTDIYVSTCFSLPNRAQNQRGYVSYGYRLADAELVYIDNRINYFHQLNIQYPAITAEEFLQTNAWSSSYFKKIQSAIQINEFD